jgi:L-lactate utilization protein LutC
MATDRTLDALHIAEENLQKNGFLVYVADTAETAKTLFFNAILSEIHPKSISHADSLTLKATHILDGIRTAKEYEFIETFDREKTREENIEQRRKALTVDLFLTGTNAVTEQGQLMNLDMVGNRVAALAFGPKNVVLVIGSNKIVKDVEAGKKRIKEICAPRNAKRHKNFKTPCQITGECIDCSSEQRICNIWSIIEKCYPKHRIRIILIEEPLGY